MKSKGYLFIFLIITSLVGVFFVNSNLFVISEKQHLFINSFLPSASADIMKARIVKKARLPDGNFGQLIIPTKHGKKLALATVKLSVNVTVKGRIARTEVEQVFYNPTSRQTEGTFTFRLPYGAAITRLAMEIKGKLIEGELVERTRARAIYNSIVRKMKDPALLEWQGGNRFRTQIFPIPAKGKKRIIIGYDHVLTGSSGYVDYVYLLPRAKTGDRIGLFQLNLMAKGHPDIKVLPYDSSIQMLKKSKKVSYSAKNFLSRGHFVVRLSHKKKRGILYSGIAQKKKYGLLELPIRLKKTRRSFNNKVFILDTSAGMRQKGLQKAIEVCQHLLQFLPKNARFGVIAGDLEARPFKNKLMDIKKVSNAINFIQSQSPRGATDLEKLFLASIKLAKNKAELIYIGDGIASLGLIDPNILAAKIQKKIGKRALRFSAIAIGPNPDVGFLQKLARATGGRVIRLQIGENPKAIVKQFNKILQVPQLTDIDLSIKGMKNYIRFQQGNVASGESILIAGEMTKPAIHVTLNGKIDRFQSYHFKEVFEPISETSKPIVPAFWAKFQIEKLQKKASKKRHVIKLSKNYGVMSRYTSFLVLENDKAYKRYQIKRRKHKQKTKKQENVVRKIAHNKSAEGKDRKEAIKHWLHSNSHSRNTIAPTATGRHRRSRSVRLGGSPSNRGLALESDDFGGGGFRNIRRRTRRSKRARRPRRHFAKRKRLLLAPKSIAPAKKRVRRPMPSPAPITTSPRAKLAERSKRICLIKLRTSPRKVKIYINAHYLGKTNKTIKVPCNKKITIVLKKRCYKTKKIHIKLRRNRVISVQLSRDLSRPCRRHASLNLRHRSKRTCYTHKKKQTNWKHQWLKRHRRLVAKVRNDNQIKMAYRDVMKDPTSWSAHRGLYRLLISVKRYKAALLALREWRRYAPEEPNLIQKESKLLIKLGFLKESRRVLSELIEFAPHNYSRRMKYAYALKKQGNLTKACYQFAQAVRLNPARRNTFRTMMSLYRKRYKNKEIRDIIRACIVQGVSRLPVVRDVSLIMFWEDPSADIDLHIHEPNGEHVYYSHRESRQGGTLYFDITNGIGPEVYVLGTGKKGKYRITIVYYRGKPRVIKGKLLVLQHAGSSKETRKVYPFKLYHKKGRKEIYITTLTLK